MYITGIRRKTTEAQSNPLVEAPQANTILFENGNIVIKPSNIPTVTGPPTLEIVTNMLKTQYDVEFDQLVMTANKKRFPLENGSYVFTHKTTGEEYIYTNPGKGVGYWLGNYTSYIPPAPPLKFTPPDSTAPKINGGLMAFSSTFAGIDGSDTGNQVYADVLGPLNTTKEDEKLPLAQATRKAQFFMRPNTGM